MQPIASTVTAWILLSIVAKAISVTTKIARQTMLSIAMYAKDDFTLVFFEILFVIFYCLLYIEVVFFLSSVYQDKCPIISTIKIKGTINDTIRIFDKSEFAEQVRS